MNEERKTLDTVAEAVNTISKVDSTASNGVWYFNWYKKLPKVLRVIVQVLLVITLVYYTTILLYKIWDGFGKILHWLTEKRNWWVYSTSILILIIGGLIIMQIYSPYKPFTEIGNWFVWLWDKITWWN